MPLPRRLARFNRTATNHLVLPVAGRLPGFAIVRHRGRRSGRPYRTPVNCFRHGDGYRFGITYGAGSDWVRNVVAAGSFEITTKGRRVALTHPVVGKDAESAWAPRPVRWVLKRIDAPAYLDARIAH